MSENEEKKSNASDDKKPVQDNTQPQTESAESGTSEIKTQPAVSSETKKENETEKETAETQQIKANAEGKSTEVPPVNNNPPKGKQKKGKQKKGNGENPWKTIAIILASLIVGFCGGLLSGHLSAKSAIADFKEEQAENSQNNNFPDFFREFGGQSQNGNSDNDNSSGTQQNTNKAALGIMVQDTQDGPEIVDFTAGTNASEAGLQKGDIIIRVDDTEVSSVSDVRAAIADKKAGDTVSVTVTRDGKEQNPVKVTLIDNTESSEHSDFPDGSNIQG